MVQRLLLQVDSRFNLWILLSWYSVSEMLPTRQQVDTKQKSASWVKLGSNGMSLNENNLGGMRDLNHARLTWICRCVVGLLVLVLVEVMVVVFVGRGRVGGVGGSRVICGACWAALKTCVVGDWTRYTYTYSKTSLTNHLDRSTVPLYQSLFGSQPIHWKHIP